MHKNSIESKTQAKSATESAALPALKAAASRTGAALNETGGLAGEFSLTASGGEAGTALAIQKSLGAARKPFRVFKVR